MTNAMKSEFVKRIDKSPKSGISDKITKKLLKQICESFGAKIFCNVKKLHPYFDPVFEKSKNRKRQDRAEIK
jgi:hypothetical protein